MAEPGPGAIVAGIYRVEYLLGRGGMGSVWAATSLADGAPVALKFLLGASAHADVRRRFLREAKATRAVVHPNVVALHGVVALEDETPVLVMELLSGETLKQRLARDEALPLAETARILLPVLDAVVAAHRMGVVHRDLKPDNLFLVARPVATTKVLDFGIAKLTATLGAAAATLPLTALGAPIGTPGYMPPEQLFGEPDIDHRADVWALGAVLYECLSGGTPVDGRNAAQVARNLATSGIAPLASVAPGTPPDVSELAARMLATTRDRRLADLTEASAVLARHA